MGPSILASSVRASVFSIKKIVGVLVVCHGGVDQFVHGCGDDLISNLVVLLYKLLQSVLFVAAHSVRVLMLQYENSCWFLC